MRTMPGTTNPTPSPLPPVDPLGEVLHLLRLTGTLYCRAELTAPWGITIPEIEGCMVVHIVTAGSCRIEVAGDEPRELREGSLVLLPHGSPHTLRSDADAVPDPLFDLPVEKLSERYEIMRHGGGGAFAQTTTAVVRVDAAVVENLLALFPNVLQLDAWDDASGWLQSTLRFIAQEAKELKPGGETVITRLADILIIQAIRSWIDSASHAEPGWLAALRDDQIGRALVLMHREPQHPWTVASLADAVHMSRSAFAARFTELVGQPALQYLTGWRMQVAQRLLQESAMPLAELAGNVGYQSEAAFSRAFKKAAGVAPGRLRRESSR